MVGVSPPDNPIGSCYSRLCYFPSDFYHGVRVVWLRIITGLLEGWEGIPMGKRPCNVGGVIERSSAIT